MSDGTPSDRRSGATAAAGAATAVVVIAQTLWIGRSIVVLDLGLLVAFAVWSQRPELDLAARRRLRLPFGLAIGVQLAHFLEELAGGLHVELPALFGTVMSRDSFVALNLLWLVAFALAWLRLPTRDPWPVLVVWFFALVGGLANGLLHPLLALRRGGYFPGLWTSPVLLLLSVPLLCRLTDRRLRLGRSGTQGTDRR